MAANVKQFASMFDKIHLNQNRNGKCLAANANLLNVQDHALNHLDAGVKDAVLLLRKHGVETVESEDQRFRKYQWVELTVTKASDPRPESYKLKPDGIKILSEPLPTRYEWQARKGCCSSPQGPLSVLPKGAA